MRRIRPIIVFVGGFDDRVVKGGQVFACKSLVGSPLSDQVRWSLVDTTMASLPPPPVWRRALTAVGRLVRLARLLAARPDAALIFTSSGSSLYEKSVMVLMARLCGVPTILCPRCGMIIERVERSPWQRLAAHAATRAASLIVCQGRFWAEYYRRLAPATPSVAIPNFIDIAHYGEIPADDGQDAARILFLGWMEKFKGVQELLAAAEHLAAEGNAFELIFAGSGAELAQVRHRIASGPLAGRAKAVGWVGGGDKLKLLAWSNILVLPSYGEGLPNVVLEAMAAGRAVVATHVGAVPEVVRHGRTGLLCAPRDVPALAAALSQLIAHPESRSSMGAAGRARAVAAHSVDSLWPLWKEAILSQTNDE